MFRNLLDWAFKQADASPDFHAQHCLSVRGNACSICADICPHQAITIQRLVKIDPVDCSGCGLCVSACPSLALTPKGRPTLERTLRCSQVSGSGPSVLCLTRLQASDLVSLAGRAGEQGATLARGDCSNCSIGSSAVPKQVDLNLEKAAALLALHRRELKITVVETEAVDSEPDRRELSRRELFSGGWQELRSGSSVLLAPLEQLAEDEGDGIPDRQALPLEHQRRLRAIALSEPSSDSLVPLRLPAIRDGCILCPSCTRACPTNAVRRVFDGDAAGGARIDLDASRCIGCDACLDACPVDVIDMREDVRWGEVHGPPVSIYRAERPSAQVGTVARPTTAAEHREHHPTESPGEARAEGPDEAFAEGAHRNLDTSETS